MEKRVFVVMTMLLIVSMMGAVSAVAANSLDPGGGVGPGTSSIADVTIKFQMLMCYNDGDGTFDGGDIYLKILGPGSVNYQTSYVDNMVYGREGQENWLGELQHELSSSAWASYGAGGYFQVTYPNLDLSSSKTFSLFVMDYDRWSADSKVFEGKLTCYASAGVVGSSHVYDDIYAGKESAWYSNGYSTVTSYGYQDLVIKYELISALYDQYSYDMGTYNMITTFWNGLSIDVTITYK